MATATNISATWYFEGEERSLANINGGSYGVWVGYNKVDGEMVGRIAFTLEKPASQLSIAWRVGDGSGGSKTFNYKIVRVDEDDGTLKNAKHPTTGDGTLTSQTAAWSFFSTNISRTLTSGEYYLYIWTTTTSASNYMGILSNNYYPITVTYTEALESSLAAENGTLGLTQTLTVTQHAVEYTHTITYSCGSASETICTKSNSTSIPWTPPLSLASQNITGSTVIIMLAIETFDGDDPVGTKTVAISCDIPSSVAPSCSISVSDAMDYASKYGYIKTLSKFAVTVSASSQYGATITAYSTTANGATYADASFITSVLRSHGTLTIAAKVTDSRGRTATASITVEVLDYQQPNISSLSVARCNEDGTANDQGEYVKATFNGSATSLNNVNTATYALKYKQVSATTYKTDTLEEYANVFAVTGGTAIFKAVTGSSFDVIIEISDDFYISSRSAIAPTTSTIMHFRKGGTGIGFGKVCEADGILDVDWDIEMNGNEISNFAEKLEVFTANVAGDTDTILAEVYAQMNAGTIKTVRLIQKVVDGLPKSGDWFVTLRNASVNYGTISATSDKADGAQEYRRLIYNGVWGVWVKVPSATDLLDLIYPVNSIYISYSHTSPASLFGGTWTRIEGAFLWGGADGSVIGQTGGATTHNHTLGDGAYAQINHHDGAYWFREIEGTSWTATGKGSSTGSNVSNAQTAAVPLGGVTDTADSMPPYIRVSIWRRTA